MGTASMAWLDSITLSPTFDQHHVFNSRTERIIEPPIIAFPLGQEFKHDDFFFSE